MQYTNGNATITMDSDGTRTTSWDGELKLEFPLNVDIKVSDKCAFGKKKNGVAICSFCHESAKFDGEECDYNELLNKLDFPAGVELAIGCNQYTDGLEWFLTKAKEKGWFANITINQGHIKRDKNQILNAIDKKLINGLGISFRPGMSDIPAEILAYENTAVNVIVGIDKFSDVANLAAKGVKKIVILGEKNFGFNSGKVNTSTFRHVVWKRMVMSLVSMFDVVSFDNLALQQLSIKEKVDAVTWETMYQGEHSFYIDAVAKTYAQSSRSFYKTHWDTMTPSEYFRNTPKVIPITLE